MPIQSGFHVEVCHWANAADRDALASVREIVFVLEQRVPRELEVDDDDPRSVHVLARAPDGTPIGTGRLTPTGRIGRMAVMADWRGNGVGTMLLRALLDQARARRMSEVVLHAQRDAVAFYLDYGFAVVGDEFEEAGIPHVRMHRALDPLPEPERTPPPPPPEPKALRASSREELIDATLQLLSGGRHSMCLWVRELHAQLLTDTACRVELRRLAVRGGGASTRLLVQDLSPPLQ